MIAIVNVGPHDDPDKLGVRTYEVRINANVVCTFKHRRADGLGMCLLKASKAVERQKWEQASRILDIANVTHHRRLTRRGSSVRVNALVGLFIFLLRIAAMALTLQMMRMRYPLDAG